MSKLLDCSNEEIVTSKIRNLDGESEALKRMLSIYSKYYELIYCVGKKFPGETRHETAKRYLIEAEKTKCDIGECAYGCTGNLPETISEKEKKES